MNLKSEQRDKPDGWPSGFSESPHDFFCLSFPHHGLFLLGPPLGPKASAWLEHLGMVPTLSSFSMGIAAREASPFASADSASTKDQLPGRLYRAITAPAGWRSLAWGLQSFHILGDGSLLERPLLCGSAADGAVMHDVPGEVVVYIHIVEFLLLLCPFENSLLQRRSHRQFLTSSLSCLSLSFVLFLIIDTRLSLLIRV
ncbi:hypothetical protein CABS01_16027 [Colletotrichum abscissum]|uniref:Uncharacterized protein n=1 Tax=Colletotrichum abscissum TaxID=1671311 RepID=A0A9P9X0X1_9PEZI|nr:uncharacterized protein CABS01_16027 [Colletotrichum abscissum]KAI3530046.1 hypothetical protein CABS02_14644 [Colletotrichum abscissum]KAK1474048.1 hypothetical protein CABS01_16027 [Colletotrichum abscissum]